MSRKVHEDMYLFNTIMKFTNRYDVANRVYDDLFGKVWTIDKIEKYVSLYTTVRNAEVKIDEIDRILCNSIN